MNPQDGNTQRPAGPGFRPQAERVNEMIRVPAVRLINADGTQVGIVPTDKALDMAYDQGLDLVEVQPTIRPPVCKIMDYGKYKYDKTKKVRIAKKKQQGGALKEMRFTPKIGDHDYSYKIQHIRDFLLDKDKVKVSVKFRGREIAHTEVGFRLLQRLGKDIDDIGKVESEPKLEGQHLIMMLAPEAKKIEVFLKQQKKAQLAAEKAQRAETKPQETEIKPKQPEEKMEEPEEQIEEKE